VEKGGGKRVEHSEVEKEGRKRRGGNCRSGKRMRKTQRWNMQE